jgi:hypothetical protein
MQKNKVFKLFLLTLLVIGLASVKPGISGGTQSTDKPLIPYVDFETTSVTYDGKANEAGFESLTITYSTTSGNTMTVKWRHNGVDLHVVISADTTGYVAIGWNNVAKSGSGATLMDGANMVLGTFGTSAVTADHIGSSGSHEADTSNDIIDSTVIEESGSTTMEFTFPLASTDSEDVALSVKSFGYFLFSIGGDDDLSAQHIEGAAGAHYMPNVYIESSDKEGYVEPTNGSFAEPIFILGALVIGAVYYKKKK